MKDIIQFDSIQNKNAIEKQRDEKINASIEKGNLYIVLKELLSL